MSVYQTIGSGQNLSLFIDDLGVQQQTIRAHERGPTTPPLAISGQLWACTSSQIIANAGMPGVTEAFLYRQNAPEEFTALIDVAHPQINAGGTVPFAADQDLGGFKLTGLGAGASASDALRNDQIMRRDGGNAATGNMNLGGFALLGLAAAADPGSAIPRSEFEATVAALEKEDAGDLFISQVTREPDGTIAKNLIPGRWVVFARGASILNGTTGQSLVGQYGEARAARVHVLTVDEDFNTPGLGKIVDSGLVPGVGTTENDRVDFVAALRYRKTGSDL
ncbi:MAG: hypothetical protein AAF108_02965 [Planctomycetota bacterium]